MNSRYIYAVAAWLEAIATILSAVKVITSSARSLASVAQGSNDPEQNNRKSASSMHKWVLIAGTLVGLITIAYLENIVSNARKKVSIINEEGSGNVLETMHAGN